MKWIRKHIPYFLYKREGLYIDQEKCIPYLPSDGWKPPFHLAIVHKIWLNWIILINASMSPYLNSLIPAPSISRCLSTRLFFMLFPVSPWPSIWWRSVSEPTTNLFSDDHRSANASCCWTEILAPCDSICRCDPTAQKKMQVHKNCITQAKGIYMLRVQIMYDHSLCYINITKCPLKYLI